MKTPTPIAFIVFILVLSGCTTHSRTSEQPTHKPMPEHKVNAIDYIEIPSRNLASTKAFFGDLFGWKFTDYGPDYVSFEDGRLTGGFYTAQEISLLSRGATLIIFYSADLEKSRERVRTSGATLTRDIFSFPGGRRFHFTEPGGSEFAIWSDQ